MTTPATDVTIVPMTTAHWPTVSAIHTEVVLERRSTNVGTQADDDTTDRDRPREDQRDIDDRQRTTQ